MEYERPPILRGVHWGPGTSCGFDIGWWVNELKQMGMGWVKIVDDGGSMYNFAKACRQAGIMPIVRMYRRQPNPGTMGMKDLDAIKRYVDEGITRWVEPNNEGNLPQEWLNDNLPQPIEEAARIAASNWIVDAERTIATGAYPAIPALAQCAHHGQCSSIRFSIAFFDWLKNNANEKMLYVLDHGAWLAVHCGVLNHAWTDANGWHFDHPYNLGQTPFDDDCSLVGYIVPRDLIWERWQRHIPTISTEGGVFHIFRQWDTRYANYVRNSYDHGVWTLEMYRWLDEWQKTHEWWYGMCEWLIGQQILGHQGIWDEEAWYRTGEVRPVVQMLKDNPPRRLDVVAPEPPSEPTPVPQPSPTPEPPTPPTPEGFQRPPGDNGMGIHLGLGDQLVGSALEEDIARAKALRVTWATVAFGAGEDVMLAAAKKLWAAGIMPVVRKVMNIQPGYAFGRDAQMLIEAGIPAYVQIFNEPSDEREWESAKKQAKNYAESDNWCYWWIEGAKQVIAAGGYPGFQCLHPHELEGLFRVLPPSDPIWERMWFCSHNYGLDHPPDWKGDTWSVLGWQIFAAMFQTHLGFVPPIICGEGGWLYKASEPNSPFPMVDDQLHAVYHKEMFRWFLAGKLSDGDPLPDYLFAVCPWILSGPSDEAWYGFTERVQTIKAIKSIPPFLRGGGIVPTPEPQPQPEPTPVSPVEYVGLAQWMKDELVIEPALNLKQPHWRVKKVEVQPGTDNFSAFALADKSQGATAALFFWADGFVLAEFKADAYTIPEARQWAASMPMFNQWGSYGVTMLGDLGNSEVVRGMGLYQKEGDQIVRKTGHHPVLVYFEKVDGEETTPEPEPQPEPEPEPTPEPVPVPQVPYDLKRRLEMAPYGYEDLRAEIAKFSDVAKLNATARRDAQGNPLFHLIEFIVVHNSGYDKPHTPMSTAKQAVAEGEPTIEYHFCIQEGKLSWTAPLVWVTNHTYGFNSRSIGVCVLGNYETKEPDPRDLETLRFLIAGIYEFLGQGWGKFRLVGLVPHRYVVKNATACPGKIWPAVLYGGAWPKLEAPEGSV